MSSFDRNSRPARRLKRGQHLARVWQFEQLESRAMLAVMGPMPYYGGDHGPQLQSFHEAPQFEAVVFAPLQFQQNAVAEPLDRGWGGGPMQGGFYDDRYMFPQYQVIEVIEVWNVAPPNLAHSNLMQPVPQPPDYLDPRAAPIAPNLGIYGTGIGNGTISSGAQLNSAGVVNNSLPPAVPVKDIMYPPADNGHRGYGDDHVSDTHLNIVDSYLQAARNASSMLSQSTPRELDAAGYVSTSALDAALQSYTSQLLLATSATSGQVATSLKASDQSLPNSDSADDFIRLGAATSQDLFAASTDAIAQERAAVEAVLKSLKDADSLPSKLSGDEVANTIAAPQAQNGQIADLVFGSAFDLADADGGMVLLKATGDANESPINLASVAEAHPDLFSGHVGVEPSIGLYQAIDMGFEELSATENVPIAKPIAQPSQQAKPGNRYSVNAGTGANSRKSAAAFTASAVAGGLLWVASRKRSDEEMVEEQSASQLVQ